MPMCSIIQCGAQKTKYRPLLTLHRLPKNEKLKKQWLDAIGVENLNSRHKMHWVCSLHFEECDFNRTLDRMRLREDTVPSLFSVTSKTSITEQDLHTFSRTSSQSPNITQDKDLTQEITFIQASESQYSIEKENKQNLLEVTKTLSQLGNTNTKKRETETHREEVFQMQENIQMIKQQEHIKRLTQICMEQRKKIKRLHEQVRKKNKKISLLNSVIEDLKTKNKMNYAQNIVMIVLD